MNRTNISTLAIILITMCILGFGTYIYVTTPNDATDSDAHRSLTSSDTHIFTDLEGNPISFDDYRGKVRVVNSWASWTPFSSQELPLFEKLALEYADKDVVVLAINRKEQREQAVGYLSTLQTFEHLLFAIDLSDSFYVSLGGYAMPETVFYDAKGNIIFHKRGNMTLEEMRLYTEAALGSTR